MRKSFLMIISMGAFLSLSQALAAEESHFLLLDRKCEMHGFEGPESTPQSPPLDVDDPETPGCNKWEINFVLDGDFSKDQKTLELPLLDINYGIGDNLQLKYEVPSVTEKTEETTKTAIGETKAGLKYLFYENEDDHLSFAIYPQVKVVHNDEESGTITTLPLLMALKIGENSHGKVTLTTNLGYNVSHNIAEQDFVSISAGVGSPISKSTSIMGELSTIQGLKATTEDPREQFVKANLGLVTLVNKSVLLFGSLGTSLVSTDDRQHLFALGGLRWVTGGI